MSALIVLLGCLLVFANPDVRSDSGRMEFGLYRLSGSVSTGGETMEGAISPSLGFSWTGEYLDQKPMRHTVSAQLVENTSYRISIYAIGLDYVLQLPNRPIQLAVGAELGSGQLQPKGFHKLEPAPEKLGWELHTEVIQYFVYRDQLLQFFLRPGWRHYDFPVKGGDNSQAVSGKGFSFSGGLGMKF